MSWDRKLWREGLSRPEYHFEGSEPSMSPVPGTMKPWSRLLSGVSFGVAVYAITSRPVCSCFVSFSCCCGVEVELC